MAPLRSSSKEKRSSGNSCTAEEREHVTVRTHASSTYGPSVQKTCVRANACAPLSVHVCACVHARHCWLGRLGWFCLAEVLLSRQSSPIGHAHMQNYLKMQDCCLRHCNPLHPGKPSVPAYSFTWQDGEALNLHEKINKNKIIYIYMVDQLC